MQYKTEYRTIELKEPTEKYITAPKNAIEFLSDTFNPIAEEMYILIMNVRNRVIEKHLVAKGKYNSMAIFPAEILRPLLINGGDRFVVCHNHPSGDSKPSEEDLFFTNKLKKACKCVGVEMLDHIIYTSDEANYTSFKKEGLI